MNIILLMKVQVDGNTPQMLVKLSELALIATICMGIGILIHGLVKDKSWKDMAINFIKISIICSAAHTPLLFVSVGDAVVNFVLNIIEM